jgi:NAD(P)H-hydrate epimerase
MKTVTAEEMRLLDRRATDEFGIPSLLLMENAGRIVADAALPFLQEAERKTAVIVCGSGNNGGDGLVAARYLFNRGIPVTVVLVKPADSFKGDAQVNFRIIKALGIPTAQFDGSLPRHGTLLIDALLGTGIKGTVGGLYADAIAAMNTAGTPVLAVDIPSGMDADTGAVPGTAVKAAVTVTMGLAKRGMVLPAAAPYIGRLIIADIGFPKQLLND